MNNLCDCIELQDLAKGYVVIKENDKVIVEGFNTIVNTGRSFILSKIAKSAFMTELKTPDGKDKYDYSGYKFFRAYLCENSIGENAAPATTINSDLKTYEQFINRAKKTNFAQNISVNNTTYDIENRDLILTFDISGNYSDSQSRVISSVILTFAIDEDHEVMFSRFTFDPKVISGNALIRINYHIHF